MAIRCAKFCSFSVSLQPKNNLIIKEITTMKKIRAAVVGYGNIGQYAVQALEAADDFEIAGIVRRNGAENKPAELAQYDVVKDIRELKDVDVAILATPSRSCEEYAKKILPLGINTVDSFDIHTSIIDYRCEHYRRWMGSGFRLYRAHPYAEPCPEGFELHQLWTGYVDGPLGMRAL